VGQTLTDLAGRTDFSNIKVDGNVLDADGRVYLFNGQLACVMQPTGLFLQSFDASRTITVEDFTLEVM
jgi:hypothetical protein